MKAWISAIRPRTLPLTLCCIAIGNCLAYQFGIFQPEVFWLSLATAAGLQILSNLANDYGDFVKGTDNQNRVGPERALQSGNLTEGKMKFAIILVGIISFLTGILLLKTAFGTFRSSEFWVFMALGLLSILAAVTYTIGKNAYGYHGLGDLMVFIFFGLTGVMGSFYLNTKFFSIEIFLPASAFGFLATGVLNMNNIRDIENDKACKKNTIPVVIGFQAAKVYQLILILLALTFGWIYITVFTEGKFSWIYFFNLPPFFILSRKIYTSIENKAFDSFLKFTVFASLFWSLLYCVILYLNK